MKKFFKLKKSCGNPQSHKFYQKKKKKKNYKIKMK